MFNNYAYKELVARLICLLLGTNFVLKNNKLDHLQHLIIQIFYRGT